ncbi:MAG: peptide chain release factor 1 [Deltaproteobacteria bacterium]|nr:peptide chain release factor 1 [Deltaproteobacteria bacterium]
MLSKLDGVVTRSEELATLLADPAVIARRNEFHQLSKESADMAEVVERYREYRDLRKQLEDNRELARDPEMRALALETNADLEGRLPALEERIKVLLLPRDPNDSKNILLEIRSGTGGEEAALFAADLFRMYARFAERKRWKVEVLTTSQASAGGFKEVIALIEGKDVYSHLKYESGVHRVQRVPETEAQGRIHTSAATVAVLPEAEEVDIRIDEKDLEVQVQRASGPGGQGVNTTDSAVRLTHKPTGLQVLCMDERSQHKNKAKAMKILRSRLLEMEQEKQDAERTEARRSMVRSGDRSEKIRTYNFPQDRLTDHRIGLTVHNLPTILDGALDDIIEALRTHFQAEALRGQT